MSGIDISIYNELYILSEALLTGAAFTVSYDVLRIARRVVRHNIVFISIEDIVFWVACGLITFKMFYDYNGGTVRVHIMCALLLGIVLYHVSLSGILVRYISLLLTEIVKPVLKVLKFLSNKVKIVLSEKNRTEMKNKSENNIQDDLSKNKDAGKDEKKNYGKKKSKIK